MSLEGFRVASLRLACPISNVEQTEAFVSLAHYEGPLAEPRCFLFLLGR